MSASPKLSDQNAIFVPSGDHAGFSWSSGLRVSRVSPRPSDADGVELAVSRSAAREDEALRVGRPGWIPVVRGVSRDPSRVAPVRVRDVDLVVAVAARHERDARPVGRGDRLVVDRVARDDAGGAIRIRRLGIELERAHERRVRQLAVASPSIPRLPRVTRTPRQLRLRRDDRNQRRRGRVQSTLA